MVEPELNGCCHRRRLTCLAIAAEEQQQQPDVGVPSLFIYSLARLKKRRGGET